jgi:hyperosmotically inducible protein
MRLMLLLLPLLAVSAAITACEREPSTGTRPDTTSGARDQPRAPDNTARNRPDRDMDSSITPEDQSNTESDIELTAAIRRAVVQDETFSINAKNVKIIADKSGTVTLRGVVDTQAEKDAVEAKARAIAGVRAINNMIEVNTP